MSLGVQVAATEAMARSSSDLASPAPARAWTRSIPASSTRKTPAAAPMPRAWSRRSATTRTKAASCDSTGTERAGLAGSLGSSEAMTITAGRPSHSTTREATSTHSMRPLAAMWRHGPERSTTSAVPSLSTPARRTRSSKGRMSTSRMPRNSASE